MRLLFAGNNDNRVVMLFTGSPRTAGRCCVGVSVSLAGVASCVHLPPSCLLSTNPCTQLGLTNSASAVSNINICYTMHFILISFVFRVPPSKQAAEYIHESSQRDCSGGGCDHKSMVTGSGGYVYSRGVLCALRAWCAHARMERANQSTLTNACALFEERVSRVHRQGYRLAIEV